jgi:hypothetical protein
MNEDDLKLVNPEAVDDGESVAADVVDFPGDSVRERLVAALKYELLGPSEPSEVISQSPATRYLVGMLAPQQTQVGQEEDDAGDVSVQGDEGTEPPAPMSMSLNPSSIGISFVVDASSLPIRLVASWGEYAKREASDPPFSAEEATDLEVEGDPDESAKKKRKRHEWHRTPREETVEITDLPLGRAKPVDVGDHIQVQWMVRRVGNGSETRFVVSAFLVNARVAPVDRRPPDETWIYQPGLRVTPSGPGILPRRVQRERADFDPDVASADLIYRNRHEFATGHGVSADWNTAEGAARTTEIWTEVLPRRRVPIVKPLESGMDQETLNMDRLAELSPENAGVTLRPLTQAYAKWIEDRKAELSSVDRPDDETARYHLHLADLTLLRIRAGIELLENDPLALKAFQFANQAMARQRRASVRVLTIRRGNEPPKISEIAVQWRPFQLGFILQCLAGVVDPKHVDRGIADLLWFPTGGGKTEAYLGLTAFVLAHRRLRNDTLDGSSGTSVLMRYTLRLLTIQQFQRATALLCACESVRLQDENVWGSNPFTIGLWVGQSVTPNSYEDAKEALEKLTRGEAVYEKSPYLILFCPWCGTDLDPSDYASDDDLERTFVKCSNRDCDFAPHNSRFGLPVLLVDREIYRHPPSLLLATVDKFAQMAWNGRVQALFGRVERYCERHGYLSGGEKHPANHRETAGWPAAQVQDVTTQLSPPDLIIQDELHLISGPLGTLVGVYETAVEGLCTRQVEGGPVRPKVVASTATIRRAGQQIEAIFNKKISVFPPLGLDASDSFFAREDAAGPGRLYLGVYAPGKSIKTALVRVYASMLLRAKVEFDEIDPADADARKVADAYMTLVGYFNSLRELGGARRLVDDDVPARMRVLSKRKFGRRRFIYEPKELTSRAQSSEIGRTLKQLDRTFIDVEAGKYPIDILLASNMISVGVDIDRLGLMVVSAQPKTSAEYIQASSRVGRVYPGLVIEVYNWIRPRDTSHFERFIHYHDTFYRHVEATSVTPFSARARDRALPGVLTAYIRQTHTAMSPESGAENIGANESVVQSVVQDIVARSRSVTERDDVAVATELKLKNLVGEWEGLTGGDPSLVYSGRGLKKEDRERTPVLIRPMEASAGGGIWEVSGSLREVEPEVDVVLIDDGGGAE